MDAPEPRPSPFTLRWRLLGVRFSIQPSFWIMSALFGWFMADSLRGRRDFFAALGVWILCTLVSVMVHELGHALTGRLFGQPANICLAGMGGQASGNYEDLRSWQRVLVILAGPGAGFLFLALQIVVDFSQWNMLMSWLDWEPLKVKWTWSVIDQIDPLLRMGDNYFFLIMRFLLFMNLIWNLFNLIPIIPLDGGMLMREGCLFASPRGGLKLAFGLSFMLAGSIVVYAILKMTIKPELPTFSIHPLFAAIMFGMMAMQNFFSLLDASRSERQERYQERDDE